MGRVVQNYRLDQFETARDLYEDLIATAEPVSNSPLVHNRGMPSLSIRADWCPRLFPQDAPELIDLQTNLDACQSSVNFLSSLPSAIANASIPPLETLEAQPIGPLLAPIFKAFSPRPVASTSVLLVPASDAATKAPRGKLPRNYEASVAKGKGPDPDRWLPYRERPGMAELIVAKREKARGRNKELMQGGAADEGAKGKAGPGTPAKAGGGGGGVKKKKGKK